MRFHFIRPLRLRLNRIRLASVNDEGGRDDNVAHAQFMNAGQVIYLFLDGVTGMYPPTDINVQQF